MLSRLAGRETALLPGGQPIIADIYPSANRRISSPIRSDLAAAAQLLSVAIYRSIYNTSKVTGH